MVSRGASLEIRVVKRLFSKHCFLCPLRWFQPQLCWAVLCAGAACYLKSLTYVSFSVSEHICRGAQKWRRFNAGATFQPTGEERRCKDPLPILQREDSKIHSLWFCRASPALLNSFTHSGKQNHNTALIAFSSFPGSLFQLSYSCSLGSPHQSTTCTQVPVSDFVVIGNSN